MGIATKHRRKINVKGRIFVWYVCEDIENFSLATLHVISEDKRFNVAYSLFQYDTQRHMVVLGKEFPGLAEAGHCWNRVVCPQWEVGRTITPASVRRLIEWSFDSSRHLILVDWTGKPLTKTEDEPFGLKPRISDTL